MSCKTTQSHHCQIPRCSADKNGPIRVRLALKKNTMEYDGHLQMIYQSKRWFSTIKLPEGAISSALLYLMHFTIIHDIPFIPSYHHDITMITSSSYHHYIPMIFYIKPLNYIHWFTSFHMFSCVIIIPHDTIASICSLHPHSITSPIL